MLSFVRDGGARARCAVGVRGLRARPRVVRMNTVPGAQRGVRPG